MRDPSEQLAFSSVSVVVLALDLDMLRQLEWQGEDVGAQVLAEPGC